MVKGYTDLTSFHDQGDDALSNMFSLTFTAGTSVTGLDAELQYRVTNFNLPETVVNTYDKWYRGHKYSTPNGLDGDPKITTFTFRADKDQEFYIGLRKTAKLAKLGGDGATANFRSDITVIGIDTEGAITTGTSTGWVIKGWFPTNVQGISFDQNSGEPILVQVTGSFMYINEPV